MPSKFPRTRRPVEETHAIVPFKEATESPRCGPHVGMEYGRPVPSNPFRRMLLYNIACVLTKV